MPNHVTNLLCAPAEVIDALMGDDGVDFNRIIPAPAALEAVGEIHMGVSELAKLVMTGAGGFMLTYAKDFSDADFEKLILAMRCYRECGHVYWYDWKIAKWGTKWGGYSTKRIGPSSVQFQTAWSAPHIVIEKLASQFPSHEIRHSWADEDTGHNCGIRIYANGQVTESIPDGGSKEAYELAFSLNPEDREHYRLNALTNNYEYYDADEMVARIAE